MDPIFETLKDRDTLQRTKVRMGVKLSVPEKIPSTTNAGEYVSCRWIAVRPRDLAHWLTVRAVLVSPVNLSPLLGFAAVMCDFAAPLCRCNEPIVVASQPHDSGRNRFFGFSIFVCKETSQNRFVAKLANLYFT